MEVIKPLSYSLLIFVLKQVGTQIYGMFSKREETKTAAKLLKFELEENQRRLGVFDSRIQVVGDFRRDGVTIELHPYYPATGTIGEKVLRLIGGKPERLKHYSDYMAAVQMFEQIAKDYQALRTSGTYAENLSKNFSSRLKNSEVERNLGIASTALNNILDEQIRGSRFWQLYEEKSWVKWTINFLLLVPFLTFAPDLEE